MTPSSLSTLPESAPISPGPLRPIPLRRRLLFIGVVLAAVGILQEVCFRFAFPMPEVAHFNRIHYARVHHDGIHPERDDEGARNLIYRVECEPDGFSFDLTLNL